MVIGEEAISNGAGNGSGMCRRRRHPSNQHEVPTKRPRLSQSVLNVIPKWMRCKVGRLNFTNHPTMQPIIEINLFHYDRDEMAVDTTSSFYNEGDVGDERNEVIDIDSQ